MTEEMEKYGVECKCNHNELQQEMEKKASKSTEGNVASTQCPHCGKVIEAKKENS